MVQKPQVLSLPEEGDGRMCGAVISFGLSPLERCMRSVQGLQRMIESGVKARRREEREM